MNLHEIIQTRCDEEVWFPRIGRDKTVSGIQVLILTNQKGQLTCSATNNEANIILIGEIKFDNAYLLETV